MFARLADDPTLLLFTRILLTAQGLDTNRQVAAREETIAYFVVLTTLLDGEAARAR